MSSWYDKGLSAIILTATVAYTACALSHIATMWTLRNEFEVAVRSPILAILSGTAGALVSCFRILRAALFPGKVAGMIRGETVAIFHHSLMVNGPLVLLGFTCSYAVRGLRLLVMYHPHMRGRWGKPLRQHAVIKGMVLLFVLLEVMLWSASAVNGVDSVASMAPSTLFLDHFITVITCIVLAGKLRKTEDLFCVSQEIQRAGCCALASLALLPLLQYGPVRTQSYIMQLYLAGRFHTALWFTNIQPIRSFLQRRNGYNKRGVHAIFPYVPWERSRKKVAVDEKESNSVTVRRRSTAHMLDVEGSLERILNFPPLLQAFEDFCVKALCIESLHFLVAVTEFQESSADFGKFIKILETYITSSSPFEVNISSKTRAAILHKTDTASFAALSLDDKKHILDDAVKEVANMLKENLANKFRATKQYKDLNEMIFSAASIPEPPCRSDSGHPMGSILP